MPLQRIKAVPNLLRVMGDIKFCNFKGIHPRLLQGLQFIAAHLQNLLQVLLLFIVLIDLLCHGSILLSVYFPGAQRSIEPMR